MEKPAPLFSLAEAEATLRPGETQGRRGLPPLAYTLRKRSQVRTHPLTDAQPPAAMNTWCSVR